MTSDKRELKDFQEKKMDPSGPKQVRGAWRREQMLARLDKLFALFLKWKRRHRKIQNRVESLSSFKIFLRLLDEGQEFPKRTLSVFQEQGSCASLVGREATVRIEKESDYKRIPKRADSLNKMGDIKDDPDCLAAG